MRTTLKRGIGRGAGVDGNGRAVLPPAALTPMTLYQQPARKRRTGLQLVGRILLWLLIAVLVVAAGLLGGAYLYFHEQVKAVQAHTPELIRAEKGLDVTQAGKPATALIIGYDHRAGPESSLPSRSDTIMLVRADPIDKTVSLLSFPRDLLVPIYCRPGQPITTDRINSAYERCPNHTRGTLETVKALTGLSVNYLITVNFRGFKQVVDKLGGVWIDVDRRYFNDNAGLTAGYNTYATINLQPGYQRLNGSDALDFVRYRHTDSDLYRVARQQAFVKAFKDQVSQSFSIKKIPKLVHAITSNVEVGQAGNRQISPHTIVSYALFLYGLPNGHFFQPKVDNLQQAGPFNAELQAPPGAVEQAVREFTNPDVEAPGKASAQALGTKFRSHAVKPSQISLVVLNGNGKFGSAANASAELARRHYRVVVPPDPHDRNVRSDYKHTVVFYDPQKKLAAAGARRVARLFSDAAIATIPPTLRSHQFRAMLIVVVGASFDGTFAPQSAVDQTPKKEPPAVVSNPGASVPLVRSVQRKVPFRLEYPLLLERTSSPSTLEPVRSYWIAKGYKAVRLIYSTNTIGDYWGIEETNWPDAPVLRQPNFKHRIKGREFDFYYSGPNLHMIVLREHGATYWVTNTLLDKLSNETMLAIAKSLRPLGK
jgi:LCP family protein required for cell wall assembly